MSLFVFQQKIPFQSVIRWLRYYAPGGEMPAAEWASGHAADIAPGDMLFIWEPIYSPWGDASSGIGVADGDSFKVSQMFFVTKWDNNAAFGYNITPDTYKAQTVASYLEECVNTAKGNGIGFYFSLVRSNPALTEDKLKALEAMDSYGLPLRLLCERRIRHRDAHRNGVADRSTWIRIVLRQGSAAHVRHSRHQKIHRAGI
jgi:hypothetical protein